MGMTEEIFGAMLMLVFIALLMTIGYIQNKHRKDND